MTSETQVEFLLKMLDIMSKIDLVKPSDPEKFFSKLQRLEEKGVRAPILDNCCEILLEVKDSKDLKPYILGALDTLSNLLGVKVENDRHW